MFLLLVIKGHFTDSLLQTHRDLTVVRDARSSTLGVFIEAHFLVIYDTINIVPGPEWAWQRKKDQGSVSHTCWKKPESHKKMTCTHVLPPLAKSLSENWTDKESPPPPLHAASLGQPVWLSSSFREMQLSAWRDTQAAQEQTGPLFSGTSSPSLSAALCEWTQGC